MTGYSRRRLCTMGLGAFAAVVGGACVRTSRQSQAPAPPSAATTAEVAPAPTAADLAAPSSSPTGQLILVLGGKMSILDLATQQSRPVTDFLKGGFAAAPALSPDRARIAYTSYLPPTDRGDLGGNDLYVVGVDGRHPRLLLGHSAAGVSLETPSWTRDGAAILATKRVTHSEQGKFVGLTLSTIRVPLDGTLATELLPNAIQATLSLDGKRLAYVAVDPQGIPTGLWLASPDGKGAQQVRADPPFGLVGAPAFAPDGSHLAFAASGGPVMGSPGQDESGRGWIPLGADVAEAHNAYWEIWTVRSAGTGLNQITNLSEDGPVPTWSPDGRWIGIAGEMGLYVAGAAGQQTTRISADQSSGIAWLA